jgi:GAF domain-containing protein/HAMP domain-containing protein
MSPETSSSRRTGPGLSGWLIAAFILLALLAGSLTLILRPPTRADLQPGLILALSAALLLLPALAGWLLGRRLSRSLSQITSTMQRLATGDLAARVETPTAPADFSLLAASLNQMSAGIAEQLQTQEARSARQQDVLQQRDSEIDFLTHKLERRKKQMSAVARAARATSTAPGMEAVLSDMVTIISQAFDSHHVGLFLLDESHQHAILTASSSPEGQRLVGQGFNLPLEQATGNVSIAALTRQPRITLEAPTDPGDLEQPEFASSRSQISLPLLSATEPFGVLDIHSLQPGAFDEEDLELLFIFADQLGAAIQNIQQSLEASRATAQASEINKQYIRQAWRILVREERRLGYRASRAGVGPLKAPVQSPEIETAISTGQLQTFERDGRAQLAIPIRLHGQVIGTLNIQADGKNPWEQDELDICIAAAERVALAMENARLLETSQTQAARERTLGEMTSHISNSVTTETLLQTAVTELGHLLPGSGVTLLLGRKEATENLGTPPEFKYSLRGGVTHSPVTDRGILQRVAASGTLEFETGENAFLCLPITLRDEMIGVLKLTSPGKTLWKNDEISLIQAVADRIAISAENARLFEETRSHAMQEKIIGEITTKIGASINLRNVLEITVAELARAIPGAEVLMQFQNKTSPPGETQPAPPAPPARRSQRPPGGKA